MKKKILILAVALISVMVLAVAAAFIGPRTFDLEDYRAGLIRTVKTELNREVRFGKGSFTLGRHPAFTFTDVVILEKDAQTVFIAADRLSFKLTLLPLLAKKIVLREVALENPRVTLIRDASGAFNVSDLLNDQSRRMSVGIRRLRIDNGALHFTDHAMAPQALETALEGVSLHLGRLERGKAADFQLNATVADAEKSGSIALAGSIEIAPAPESLLKSRIDAGLRVSNLETGRFWPYYRRHVPFRRLTGRLDVDARFRGTAGDFESGGSATLHGLHFAYPPVFRAPLQPKTVHAVYEMKRDHQEIAVTRLDAAVDGVTVRGSCLLKDIRSGDPLIDARASTSEIPWESFSHYVPYGIIPADVADFIGRKIKAGIFRLDEGRLFGRFSQIARMEKGDNCNVLNIRGGIRKGVLAYAPDVPVFTDISGILELRGRDFILRDMTGKFGDAAIRLEGKLADYCLETPTRYPFSLKMSPTAKEVSWLLGDEISKKLQYKGTSTLVLSGDGILADYHLSGAWDLGGASYKYTDLFIKPKGKANGLNFKINLNPQEVLFRSITYRLSPLALTASATYRRIGQRALSLAIDTNPVRMEDLSPLLPKVEKFEPRGQVQAAVRARSRPQDLSDLRWRGDIALTDASFKPADAVKPLSHVTGKIRLRGHAMETSQMTLHLGESVISARATVADLRTPIVAVTFGSERVDMADLGLHHPERPVHLENVSGSIAFMNGGLQIDALNFQINESRMNVRGALKNLQGRPEARISVASTYLDGRDLLILGDLKQTETPPGPSAGMSLDADVRADAGRMDRLTFENLQTTLSLDKNIIYLKEIALNALGGRLAGNGRIELADAGAPRYHFNFDLARLSAEQCLQFLEVKDRFITGAFSAKGDLTAKGVSGADLGKTALGNVRIEIEEGMLARFAVLSKIFSILNVSQLLKFQLPDMVSGGMPYRRIVSTLSFQDGVVSTRDLFIHSNAMNISAVGAVDMPLGQFSDTVVGVQPLQTVDKVVSLIPVVGWILTDENRSVLTVYFEVKGTLDDPAVTAIPVKAMARGVFDIFKNIFHLPAKLITDTGEVIFGR